MTKHCILHQDIAARIVRSTEGRGPQWCNAAIEGGGNSPHARCASTFQRARNNRI
jgi:hypothetical protein